MRTPAGKECPHYYEDFYRGRDIQECRLARENPDSEKWQPKDCNKCTVPEILQANASRDMQLTLTIKSHLMGLTRTVNVEAFCTKHRIPIDDPHVGCTQCIAENPGLDIFRQALDDSDND